jgi:hypothetical protein
LDEKGCQKDGRRANGGRDKNSPRTSRPRGFVKKAHEFCWWHRIDCANNQPTELSVLGFASSLIRPRPTTPPPPVSATAIAQTGALGRGEIGGGKEMDSSDEISGIPFCQKKKEGDNRGANS